MSSSHAPRSPQKTHNCARPRNRTRTRTQRGRSKRSRKARSNSTRRTRCRSAAADWTSSARSRPTGHRRRPHQPRRLGQHQLARTWLAAASPRCTETADQPANIKPRRRLPVACRSHILVRTFLTANQGPSARQTDRPALGPDSGYGRVDHLEGLRERSRVPRHWRPGWRGSLTAVWAAAWSAASSAAASLPGTRRSAVPTVTHHADRACKSGRTVLLAPCIVSPRKEPTPMRRTHPQRGLSALKLQDALRTGLLVIES